MTIAQQLKIKEFPFIIKDNKGNEIYYEESSGCWVKKEFDDNGKNIYFEDSDGGIFERRPKPEQALISQLEEIVSRLEEDGLYALQGIKDAIAELKNHAIEKDLEIYDVWEASSGNLFIKISDEYSIAIGSKGQHNPIEEHGDLKRTQYVKCDGVSPVKKVGKIVFD